MKLAALCAILVSVGATKGPTPLHSVRGHPGNLCAYYTCIILIFPWPTFCIFSCSYVDALIGQPVPQASAQLQPKAFHVLPLGTLAPKGWLLDQVRILKTSFVFPLFLHQTTNLTNAPTNLWNAACFASKFSVRLSVSFYVPWRR